MIPNWFIYINVIIVVVVASSFELLPWQHVNSSVMEDLVEEELDIEQQVH